MIQETDEPFLADRVEKSRNIGVQDEVHFGAGDSNRQGIKRIVRAALGPEPIREPEEILLVNRIKHRDDSTLDDFIFHCGHRQRTLPPVWLRYIPSS